MTAILEMFLHDYEKLTARTVPYRDIWCPANIRRMYAPASAQRRNRAYAVIQFHTKFARVR